MKMGAPHSRSFFWKAVFRMGVVFFEMAANRREPIA